MKHPASWPEPWHGGTVLVLLLVLAYVLQPKSVRTFIQNVLEALDE